MYDDWVIKILLLMDRLDLWSYARAYDRVSEEECYAEQMLDTSGWLSGP